MNGKFISITNGVTKNLGVTALTILTFAVFVTSLAHVAKNKVFLDCSTCVRAGLMVQMMAVLAFPPKESCKIRVSFESRYGMCPLFFSELQCKFIIS